MEIAILIIVSLSLAINVFATMGVANIGIGINNLLGYIYSIQPKEAIDGTKSNPVDGLSNQGVDTTKQGAGA